MKLKELQDEVLARFRKRTDLPPGMEWAGTLGSAIIGETARGNPSYGYLAGMGWRRPGSMDVRFVFEATGKTKVEALHALAQLADRPLEGDGKIIKASQIVRGPSSSGTRRAPKTKKAEVTVTFDLPDNPESIEEVERLLVEQWQAQLPKVRHLLEKAAKNKPRP